MNASQDATLTFQLQPSPFGHVGVFPSSRLLAVDRARVAAAQRKLDRPPRVLNLFAYTAAAPWLRGAGLRS